jgi:2-polyprenyl-6-methoxyphenol hydroxylase-like FAD-dependent oxidoreductase
MKREVLSGIDVLVVGAGLGGLFAAVELYRQGHNVRVIEAKPGLEGLGSLHPRTPPAYLIVMYHSR